MRKVKRALELYVNYFLLRRMPILTYSMERTGSTAMFRTLESHGLFVIGAHYLDPKKMGKTLFSGSARWTTKHIISKRKPAKVIALVRRPIENMLSTFARSDYGEREVHQNGNATQDEPLSPVQLSDEFCQAYLESERYLGPLSWFTNEFQSALGINVYEHSFDKQNGYCRIRQEPYDVLILRTEMADDQKEQLVSEFLGISSLKMTHPSAASDNRGRLPSGKPGDKTYYAAKYKALKQNLVIPKMYLDNIIDSSHVEHFFTKKERDEMRTKYGGQ